MHMAPGDIALILAGEDAVPENIEFIREKYGLDKPLQEQVYIYLSSVIRGDLGHSYAGGRPVIDMILERVPATLLLMLVSQALGLVLGTLIGIYLARIRGSKTDIATTTVAYVLYSIPVFWMGLLLILIFALRLDLFPASGMTTLIEDKVGIDHALDVLWHLVLPVTTLAMWYVPSYIRVARASAIDVFGSDFILTARSKGLKESTILLKHVLRNASLPIVTIAGFRLGFAVTGAVMTESVFGWPGLGKLIYSAIVHKDYPVIMGSFIIASIVIILANLLADITLAKLDPRIVYK